MLWFQGLRRVSKRKVGFIEITAMRHRVGFIENTRLEGKVGFPHCYDLFPICYDRDFDLQ